MAKNLINKTILLIIFFNLSFLASSQKSDSIKVTNYFGGGVTVTNNGISLIPTFSLGKPARRNFPVVFAVFGNKTIQSHVPGHKDFVWNASLIYSFKNKYVKA
jgi:hypothetical protein